MGDIARRSNDKGFLQIGNTVEVVKKAETPNESPVVKRTKVISLDYHIHNLQLQKVQEGVSDEDNVLVITEFDPKEHNFRKVDPGSDSDDESEKGSSVVYHNNEEYDDTD